jgi:predicted RNase H-like nuclease (RuvC/YqgF family)
MTENVEFTPEQQAKIDEIVKQRVARERERFEKESGVENLKTQLESKEKEISEIKKTHSLEWELAKRGLDTPLTAAKVENIKKLIDLDSETDPKGATRLARQAGSGIVSGAARCWQWLLLQDACLR